MYCFPCKLVKVVYLYNSLYVYCDEIPYVLAVNVIPLNECRDNNVCVIKYEVKYIFTVVLSNISYNCKCRLAVFYNEVYDVIAILSQECDNLFRIVVKPIVASLCCLVAVVTDCLNYFVYELLENSLAVLYNIKVEIGNLVDIFGYNLLNCINCNFKLCNHLVVYCDNLVCCYAVKLNYKKLYVIKVSCELVAKRTKK